MFLLRKFAVLGVFLNRMILAGLGLGLFVLFGCVFAAGEGADIDKDGFARLDKNNDGAITLDEFGGDEALFKRLDRDGDGVIRRSEIAPRRPAPPPQRSMPDPPKDLSKDPSG